MGSSVLQKCFQNLQTLDNQVLASIRSVYFVWFTFYLFSRNCVCSSVFSLGFGFLSKMCLLLCYFVREKENIAAFGVERDCLAFIPGKTQAVPEMKCTFLESSSTLHRRAELFTMSSPLPHTELVLLSPAWPLFSWEVRTQTWNLTWLRLPVCDFCTTDETEIGILLILFFKSFG